MQLLNLKIFFIIIFFGWQIHAQNFDKSIISNHATDGVYGILEKDLDDDGDLDLMSASQNDNTLAYYINDGTGIFTQKIIVTDFTGATSIDGADFNNDGLMDFVAVGDSELAWFENNGDETFTKHSIEVNLDTPLQVRAYDLGSLLDPGTPDGDIDIGLLESGAGYVVVYINEDSDFTRYNLIEVNQPKYLHGGDFNNDGDPDLLVPSFGDNKIEWYKLGTWGFEVGGTVITGFNGVFGVEGGDINKDGYDDVVAAAYLDNELAWFENDGTGQNFIKHTIDHQLSGASYVHLLDIDNDNDMDIIADAYGTVSGNTTTGHQMVIYYNDGHQVFTKTIVDDTEMGMAVFSVQDFTGDNLYDIAFAANLSNEIILLKNNTLGVKNNARQDLLIYPNPASDFINIHTLKEIDKVEIFDITGRKVWIGSGHQIYLQNFKKGYYLVKVSFVSGIKTVQKIIVK